MTIHDCDDETGAYASPPCFMHEVGPAYLGEGPTIDPYRRKEVMRWRKAERERLIEARLAMNGESRRHQARRIAARLEALIGDPAGLTVSAYWPFRGEPDLREVMKAIDAGKGRCALPVVVERGKPLIFRVWRPGETLERGVWNIPVPREDAETVIPDIVIAPVVGYDDACYRLGYGGGYFDRTLAALPQHPKTIGVGYALAAIPTIFPLPHDIPLDMVVTAEGLVRPVPQAAGNPE